jgi:hypothetical protein
MTPLAWSWPAAGDGDDGDVVDLHGLLEQTVEEEPASRFCTSRAARTTSERVSLSVA